VEGKRLGPVRHEEISTAPSGPLTEAWLG